MTTLERDVTDTRTQERSMTEGNTALMEAPGPVNTNEYKMLVHQAKMAIKSRLLPKGIDTPEKALIVMLKGRELGISGMYALSNIAVIDGKPTASAELMLALIFHRHGDDAVRYTETTRERCTVRYKRRGWSDYDEYSFDIEDAKLAGLMSKDNWKKYPAAMLRARCASAIARMAFPDCIGGLYTPEELGAEVAVDAEGAFEIREESAESLPNRRQSSGDWKALYDTEDVRSQYEQVRPGVYMRAAPDAEALEMEAEEILESIEEPELEAAEAVDEPAIEEQQESSADSSRVTTPAFRAASANQLATITKLMRTLGMSGEPDESMSSADASDAITRLSREYHERRQQASAQK